MSLPDCLQALPNNWKYLLEPELAEGPPQDWDSLEKFLAQERKAGVVFPPREKTFAAFDCLAPEEVKVVLLGQDPYHDDEQAHGLAFSVPAGVKIPPSLRNIFKELAEDLQCPAPASGSLEHWREEGVLLLNTVLTVRAHEAGSHCFKGWEYFTDAVIRTIGNSSLPTVFILWGAFAGKKRAFIDETKHLVIAGAHPSPLSAYRGFFGSRPFSRANHFLIANGRTPVDWAEGAFEKRKEFLL